ncbi:MAG: hypothetical protein JOS17DRAFT_780096 [Linnemannia elongata]|nr:MAG: hypothetical protein JOS17DRAFT_780096 [Linnemannia elongata]
MADRVPHCTRPGDTLPTADLFFLPVCQIFPERVPRISQPKTYFPSVLSFRLLQAPSGRRISQTPSIMTFSTTSSQSSFNSAFSSLSQAAKKAVKPTSNHKNRSIGHGLAAIYVGHANFASAINQSHTDTLESVSEDKSAPLSRNRKRDIIPNLIRSLLPESKVKSQTTMTIHRDSISSTSSNIHSISTGSAYSSELYLPSTSILFSHHDDSNVSIHGAASSIKTVDALNRIDVDDKVFSAIINSPNSNVQQSVLSAKPHLEVFPQNISKPAVRIPLPDVGARIDTTPQLALCISLLPKTHDTVDNQDEVLQSMSHGDEAGQIPARSNSLARDSHGGRIRRRRLQGLE